MKYKPMTDVRYLVVHCSATPPDMDIGAKEIDLWHRQRGFFQIGYHVIVRRDGSVEFGRKLDQPGAHEPRVNDRSLAICLVGGVARHDKNRDGQISPDELVAENNFTDAQFATLRDVLRAWRKDWPDAEILGHRDIAIDSRGRRLKDCPSFDVRAWLAANPL